ncbi:hypothetical protein R5R35_001465 [Gryllus longicercus]|uniref:Lipase n=1 Tax=Gryllus longicercus TaxID=2509291 RepID=A0AAN9VHM6_9ORTH
MRSTKVELWWALCSCLLAAAAQTVENPLPVAALSDLRSPEAVVRAVRQAAPDLFVDLPERLQGWGYPLETYAVPTEDGYVLTMHRIPRGRSAAPNASANEGRPAPPVLLLHGLHCSSELWVVAGPGAAPALILADEGYDVWLGNFRGNHFSTKHKILDPKDPRFWMFSYHEHGLYDVTALIDYVLNATKQKRLFYFGHSMGNTALFVAASMRPEYNEKVRLCVSLSPGVYIEEASFPIILANNYDLIKATFDSLPTYKILQRSDSLITFIYLMCSKDSSFRNTCDALVSTVLGITDLNAIDLYLSRAISSSSGLNIIHFLQEVLSGELRQMDHGAKENLRRYGSPRPPAYQLANVTAPVAIFASEADSVVSAKGISRLVKVLPNVVTTHIIDEKFNHLDFLVNPKEYELIMKHVLKLMKDF